MTLYSKKYASRLAGRNLFYLGQIRKCLVAMIQYLKTPPSPSPSAPDNTTSKMMSVTEFLFALKLDNINLFKILRYLDRSRLPQKLLGFTNFATSVSTSGTEGGEEEKNMEGDEFMSKHISSLSIVQTFLTCLTSTQHEGKVVPEWPTRDSLSGGRGRSMKHPTLRYVSLQPSSSFSDILNEAHAVILAGGTLRPFSHVATELLAGKDDKMMQAAVDAESHVSAVLGSSNNATQMNTKEAGTKSMPQSSSIVSCVSSDLTTFTCGHVIPPSNVLTVCLSSGPTSTKLDFRHSSRSSDAVCDELGRTLLNLSAVVPSGLIVFLPSYSYEDHLVNRWKKIGLLDQLSRKKSVHREPKSSADLEAAMSKYSKEARGSGAILLSVVGGKMSEGINFADDMARCVLIVGLPYPDITDPELQEKMKSLDRSVQEKKGGISGNAYYHNLCMRAVNQSIGRAIRHGNDYAAVVLADARYASESRIWLGLPHWLRGSSGSQTIGREQSASYGRSLFGIRTFFKERTQNS
uniref:ATP-dependent helicase C-terminal domain-containing protein n=4 Tax=Ditylum brightwellii TaxID=49249 RepID=A0A7S4UFP6_9STRA|mmetsp:Transcript_13581/g.18960  ORF Transcript_13581/g.18960 Transcript_13581/m.18960 type:complete len:520 (+) Transcript_13581:531-2090(+)